MFSFLTVSTIAKKPVILVPGIGASNIYVKTGSTPYKWYCPKNVDGIGWINDKYVIPPVFNCILHWMSLQYDESTQCSTNMDDVTEASTVGFGTLEGITQVDVFTKYNVSFIPYYKKIIQYFENNGYVEGIDLYGAPNDWRKGIACQSAFDNRLKTLVEDIYRKTGQKVVFLCHSFGTFITHYFLSQKMSADWVNKYVDHCVFIAPSFAGAGKAVRIGWTKAYHKFIEWTDEDFQLAAETLGAVHTHFPNWDLYKGQHVFYGPDGQGYGPEDLQKIFVEHGRISPENVKLFNLQTPFLSKPIPAPRVKTVIVYNDQLETPFAPKVKSWETNDLDMVTTGGDGTVLAPGVEQFCKLHKDMTKCVNLNDPSSNGEHYKMLITDKYVAQYFEYSQE
ncbi:Lecithin:cholesterol acyltransferase family protein [Trichomonas vaginalis G3]|uniref:Lecithin:cholesterol acyltransferase family protein n=1 Tax=Trichomonas vaginalis (strain ATCC PRA-98 / G3) TaxID=412133 RepID=A2F8Z1_TRIV3|nr:O-acyltransferase protein [Trichomonas vaginalis G3]EAX98618.1 Lecithin:cholesterol acyltransferase family protein [Trichomonas vaginalis G3]KAI5513415.1 O-acyltransferase protein [Trichomonas vaginalis G3]|eukprot:XP_001311548.1 Lecithin:cholesterol acyltransferase family protein [Trichomonas vaginalis G3]